MVNKITCKRCGSNRRHLRRKRKEHIEAYGRCDCYSLVCDSTACPCYGYPWGFAGPMCLSVMQAADNGVYFGIKGCVVMKEKKPITPLTFTEKGNWPKPY